MSNTEACPIICLLGCKKVYKYFMYLGCKIFVSAVEIVPPIAANCKAQADKGNIGLVTLLSVLPK